MAGITPELNNGVYSIESDHDVDTVMNKLESVLTEKGLGIVARIDHSANARKVDLELPTTQVLIFGNPKLGTPLMQAASRMALDLPMKMMAGTAPNGKTLISWIDPAHLKSFHGVQGCDELIDTMSNALKSIASAVAA